MAISDAQRQKMADYVRSYLLRTAQSYGHQNAEFRATARWTHTLNVRKNVALILDGEGVPQGTCDVCEVAALFHDIDHYTVQLEYHAMRGAETATRFLTKEGYDPQFIKQVAEAIREHHRDLDDEIPVEDQVKQLTETLSLEARILFDADTLDKIGASNILQAVLLMGTTRRQLADAAKELTSGWPLQRAKAWMQLLTTPTGKRLGQERFAFYEHFLAQVAAEIVMDDPFSVAAPNPEAAPA
jgi:HD superfamily phosphodiesterase